MKYQRISNDILVWDETENRDTIAQIQHPHELQIIETFYVITPFLEKEEFFQSLDEVPDTTKDLLWLHTAEITEYTIEIRNNVYEKDVSVQVHEHAAIFSDLPREIQEDLTNLVTDKANDFFKLYMNQSDTPELLEKQ